MERPIFVISAPSAHRRWREKPRVCRRHPEKNNWETVLDHVVQHQGELVVSAICSSSGGSIGTRSSPLSTPWLDRFAAMSATYVVGNHDADLKHLIDSEFLAHPFFRKLSDPFERQVGGKRFKVHARSRSWFVVETIADKVAIRHSEVEMAFEDDRALPPG